MTYQEIKEIRQPEHEINELLLKRWSSRALNGQSLKDEDLFAVLEAARWAPSAFNNQPWRFIYARPKTPAWDKLFAPLGDFNKDWVKNAGALVLMISYQKFSYNQKDNPTASFDTGAAWQNLALEATSRGLIAHAMSGFDYEAMRSALNIPDDYKIEAMAALGYPGEKENLPPKIQEGEKPSLREKIASFISEGEFKQ